MSDKNIVLSSNEQNTITEALLGAKKDRIKHKKDFKDIDKVIDKVSGRITLFKRSNIPIQMFNGVDYENIYRGGKFQSEHGEFTIEDIQPNQSQIKANGNWHHKGEFEPAIILQPNGKLKGMAR